MYEHWTTLVGYRWVVGRVLRIFLCGLALAVSDVKRDPDRASKNSPFLKSPENIYFLTFELQMQTQVCFYIVILSIGFVYFRFLI